MKNFIIFAAVIIATFSFGCKKIDNPAPIDPDVANKIFRVNVTYDGTPFSLSVTQIRPSSAVNPYTFIQVQQSYNYNYGFTAAAGDTIKVVLQSTGTVNGYVGFEDVNYDFGPSANSISTPSGGSYMNYTYVVKN